MTTRHGPHLGMPTAREREIAAALHAECAGKQVRRVDHAFLTKPGSPWRTVHLDPSAGRAARDAAEAAEAKRQAYRHPPEPKDPDTGMRAWYSRKAKAIDQGELERFLAGGPADRSAFLSHFGICTHSLMAMVRLGRVVCGRRRGKGRQSGRGCCVGYVALPGQVQVVA